MRDTGTDETWMLRALEQARCGLGATSPNPAVGAVIVRDGNILGQGYHECAGEAHAERRAIRDAIERGNGDLLRGADIYVTLEPCSSHGKTPPCTDALIETGFRRVIYGAVDPDKRHRGRADALLSAAGIQVLGRVSEEACRAFLRPWMHAVETGRPWVVAKAAVTFDGRMTRRTERWLSGAEALSYAHDLRLESDAILVGGCTVRTDDPSLTIRSAKRAVPRKKVQPWRIVLTHQRDNLPAQARIFTDEYADRTRVYENVGDMVGFLESLRGELGITQLMLECGGKLMRRFFEENLINEWVQIMTPYIGGGKDLMLPGDYLPIEQKLDRVSMEQVGRDYVLRGITC